MLTAQSSHSLRSRLVVSLGERLLALTGVFLLCVAGVKAQTASTVDQVQKHIVREIRHELLLLPYDGVLDNLAFRGDGRTVTILGQVTRAVLKSDAEAAIKQIEGVEKVNNQIKVLPHSPNDDRIGIGEYRAIYGQAQLNRYVRAVPPIHIIVKNGSVTLEGAVANEADKNPAGLQANSVPGVFSVTNHLRIEP